MNKYIWLKEDKPKQTAIMLNKIDSLRVAYDAFTDLCHTSEDRYILHIYTSSKVYEEKYIRENEAYNRMKEILKLIEGGKDNERV